MNCPRCNAELSIYVLRKNDGGRCSKCGYVPKQNDDSFFQYMEAKYCPMVQDGDIAETIFDEGLCCDCICDECVLATSLLDEFGMIQDEEGNWVYPEDLDDDEDEDL